ncbi:MAG: inositol monophosphatase family protein [Candidatus Micrarchaeia archaeon]|jgi:3'-phosphoadenosine 5'-phosphosulfate (PAPS) 3'-phosphatase
MKLDARKEILAIMPVLQQASQKYIMPRFRNLPKNEIISDGSPESLVTRADTDASRHVLEWCKRRLPGSFSEEDIGNSRHMHSAVWCIDPLDGTEEFRQGRRQFCIQASLLARQAHSDSYAPAGGIIYIPASRLFIYATSRQGPFWEKDGMHGRIMQAHNPKRLKFAVRRVDPGKKIGGFLKYASKKGIEPKTVWSGSAGHTFCMMLLQKPSSPNVFIFNRDFSKEWDVSPAANALERAGWGLCGMDGKKFTYNRADPKNSQGIVAAPKSRMKEVLGLIRSFGVSNLLEPR